MKVWTKVHIKDHSRQVDKISSALTNYIYRYGPITEIIRKYNISEQDRDILNQYTSNRIAGLLMLYLAKDTARINDIVNKYNIPEKVLDDIIPEIEGYIEK